MAERRRVLSGIAVAALCLVAALPALARTHHHATAVPTHQPDIAQWRGKRAQNDIIAQFAFGRRAMDMPGHQKTIALIENELRKLGVTPREQNWTSTVGGPTHAMTNVIASMYPTAKRRILLGTHYDSLIRAYADKDHPDATMPGANNSASGVALLLETARALHAQNTAPSIGVDFVFFDGEEGPSSLGGGDAAHWQPLGSLYFAAHLADAYPGAKPGQAIVFDMVCWREEKLRPEQNSLLYAADAIDKFWNIGQSVAPAIFDTTPTPLPIFDDQNALNDVHIPSFLVIGFDYEPWANTINDTPDKCSEAALNGVGRTLLRYIYAP